MAQFDSANFSLAYLLPFLQIEICVCIYAVAIWNICRTTVNVWLIEWTLKTSNLSVLSQLLRSIE
jgi:hypothetical protein